MRRICARHRRSLTEFTTNVKRHVVRLPRVTTGRYLVAVRCGSSWGCCRTCGRSWAGQTFSVALQSASGRAPTEEQKEDPFESCLLKQYYCFTVLCCVTSCAVCVELLRCTLRCVWSLWGGKVGFSDLYSEMLMCIHSEVVHSNTPML